MHIEVSVCGTVYFLRVTRTSDQEEDSTPIPVRSGSELTTLVIIPDHAEVFCQVLPTVILLEGIAKFTSLSFLHFLSTI